jgi:hypothetical protein
MGWIRPPKRAFCGEDVQHGVDSPDEKWISLDVTGREALLVCLLRAGNELHENKREQITQTALGLPHGIKG